MPVNQQGWRRGADGAGAWQTAAARAREAAALEEARARSRTGCAALTAVLALTGAVLVVWYAAEELR